MGRDGDASGQARDEIRVIVVMGVAGAGKTTAGRAIAQTLGWAFYDADDFHSAANKAKMHRGEGLTDEDRAPWLAALNQLIAGIIARAEHATLACSALKQSYRDALVPNAVSGEVVRFVFLDVPAEVLRERLADRQQHYATPDLLPSQLATLEVPHDAVCVNGTRPVDEIVHVVRDALGL